jgi:Transport and Golgi organisation 2
MCTVSYINDGNKKYFTSNRDEHTTRPRATAPITVQKENIKYLYPKDPKAGGSWFAVSEKGTIAVLLNGAFVKHIPTQNYIKSRGVVLLDIIQAEQSIRYLSNIALLGIEPFTIILWEQEQLIECIWDGVEKYIRYLNKNVSYIWSSVTLYEPLIITKRKEKFQSFLNTDLLSQENILQFHTQKDVDTENGFLINRTSGMQTFSVTQAIVATDNIQFLHQDLATQQSYKNTLKTRYLTEIV